LLHTLAQKVDTLAPKVDTSAPKVDTSGEQVATKTKLTRVQLEEEIMKICQKDYMKMEEVWRLRERFSN